MHIFGHWECSHEFDMAEWFGFIYRVTNLKNDMMYIGRKQFRTYTRKKIVGRTNRKKIVTESNWKTYTTSSKAINQLIEEVNKDTFKFEIIELCASKAELVYREVEIQWEERVLSAKLPSGERKYYNGNIGAIKFRLANHPKDTTPKMTESAKVDKNPTIKCIIDDISYTSFKDAANALDITVGVLRRRINSLKYSNYQLAT